MNRYPYLFFDLDHTLWDFEANSIATLMVLFDEYDLEAKGIGGFSTFNTIYHEINDKLWERFRKGFLSREDLRWKRMWQTLVHFRVNDLALAKTMSEHYLQVLPTQNNIFPYAKEVLDYCKEKNYSMHLITNGFELTQYQKLKNADMEGYFDKMITSEQAMSMKPNREIFEYAFTQTGAASHNSIMIGDALDVDIAGAMGVGMAQVYFNPYKNPHGQTPTYEIHCLSELKNIL